MYSLTHSRFFPVPFKHDINAAIAVGIATEKRCIQTHTVNTEDELPSWYIPWCDNGDRKEAIAVKHRESVVNSAGDEAASHVFWTSAPFFNDP